MGSTHTSHRKEYFIVFVMLALLTLLEIWIPSLKNMRYIFKASSLVLLASGKALMVAYFYMHLKQETKYLRFIAAVPISAAVYALVVALESYYR